jgi:hypothetical protein
MLFFHNIYGAFLVHNFFACFLGVEKNYHPSQFHVTSLKIRIYHGEPKKSQKKEVKQIKVGLK